MTDADRAAAEALDRFLDTLAAGAPDPASTGALAPDLAGSTRRFHALAGMTLPASTRERVWRDLITPAEMDGVVGTEDATSMTRYAFHPNAMIGSNGRAASAPLGRNRRRPVFDSRAFIRFAAALAVAITLLAAWIIVDRRPWDDQNFGARIAAPTVAPAASPEASDVLLDVTVDRADLPTELGFILLLRNTAQPGSWHTSLDNGERGTFFFLVESGTLSVELERGGRIIRDAAGTAVEEAAPIGTPFGLEAGDALVIQAQPHSEGNRGAVPAVYLVGVVLDDIGPSEPNPDNVGEITGEVLEPAAESYIWEIAPGPVDLVVRRATLQAGEELVAPEGGTQSAAQVSGPQYSLVIFSDRRVKNTGREPVDILLVTLTPSGPRASPVAAVS